MCELTVDAALENIPKVTDFVNGTLEGRGCPARALMQIDVAVDEIFSNIARYAYRSGTGPVTVRVEAVSEPEGAAVTFIDRGGPYDPLKSEDPDVTLTAEKRQIGGLGIFIVKRTMDGMEYEYRDGKNILCLRKNFDR